MWNIVRLDAGMGLSIKWEWGRQGKKLILFIQSIVWFRLMFGRFIISLYKLLACGKHVCIIKVRSACKWVAVVWRNHSIIIVDYRTFWSHNINNRSIHLHLSSAKCLHPALTTVCSYTVEALQRQVIWLLCRTDLPPLLRSYLTY